MCGIAGLLSLEGILRDNHESTVANLLSCLQHRGPDSSGIWRNSRGCVLGHRRLSIIGLSSVGHQPMVSADSNFVLTLNGEIYNYIELADEMQLDQADPARQSDTAVLLELIRRHGLHAALQKTVGMFALAVWDDQKKELTLARDAAGKKPLYYGRFEKEIVFASELSALRFGRELKLDESSLDLYLACGYVPGPDTIFEQIKSLEEGATLTISSGGDTRFQRYHTWDFNEDEQTDPTQIQKIAESYLDESVRIRLRADVPVGCFLSGGIDSGLLAAFATKIVRAPLKTFTVTFPGWAQDEGPRALKTAELLGTEHETIVVDSNFQGLIEKVITSYGQPFADPSAIPNYLVAKAARQHVKVALSGEGADELFGGYRRQQIYRVGDSLSGLNGLATTLRRILPTPSKFRSNYSFLYRFLRGLEQESGARYLTWCMDGFSNEEIAKLKGDGHFCSSAVVYLNNLLARLDLKGTAKGFLALDTVLNLQYDMLVKADIASMAHGLEVRCPFLDRRLMQWVFSLPLSHRLGLFENKPILRSLAKGFLPSEVVDAPKTGFEVPIIDWLKNELKDYSRDYLLSKSGIISDLFQRQGVEALLQNQAGLDNDRWSRRVWRLLVLALWDRSSSGSVKMSNATRDKLRMTGNL